MPINEVSVECPYCGSLPGYACLTKSGASRRWPHRDRAREFKKSQKAIRKLIVAINSDGGQAMSMHAYVKCTCIMYAAEHCRCGEPPEKHPHEYKRCECGYPAPHCEICSQPMDSGIHAEFARNSPTVADRSQGETNG